MTNETFEKLTQKGIENMSETEAQERLKALDELKHDIDDQIRLLKARAFPVKQCPSCKSLDIEPMKRGGWFCHNCQLRWPV